MSVVQQHLSKAETARRYNVSWRWVHTLVTRYQAGGWAAVEARSRRPRGNSRAITDELGKRICTLRGELQAAGLDHGPVSIAARLQQEGLRPPAFSTIRRILTAAGLIAPEPKKRPKSSYRRFQADQPNECWQSDFTHWQLADGTGVENHQLARRPLPLPAHQPRLPTHHRPECDHYLPSCRRPLRTAAIHPDRQWLGLYLSLHRRP